MESHSQRKSILAFSVLCAIKLIDASQMNVRGAPLIAIVACLGLAVHLNEAKNKFQSVAEAANFLLEKIDYVRTSRPTAVNLFSATDALRYFWKDYRRATLTLQYRALISSLTTNENETVQSFSIAITEYAEQLLKDDVATNKAIGSHGAVKIISKCDDNINKSSKERGLRVLTICNTGSLATAGYGTALGVVRSLYERGRLEQVYALETRPYNQGARLTAFEIVSDDLPGTLITDSMAAALMATKGIDCVVVGADRVAANGDTANKIGTYQLAISAHYHGVPFYVAAPTTSLDVSIPNGSKIIVEERSAEELTW
jgi:S-methyl-5-thioribose-1-phosphate isomerase